MPDRIASEQHGGAEAHDPFGRAAARAEAEQRLAELGFSKSYSGWRGRVRLEGRLGQISVRVRLPDGFPDALPEVSVDPEALSSRIAHVEASGKICIAPESGTLVDIDRPGTVIDDAIHLAVVELSRGIRGESSAEIFEEFVAYWTAPNAGRTLSICEPDGLARPVFRGLLKSDRGEESIVAEALSTAQDWAVATGRALSKEGSAYFLPVITQFDPPAIGKTLTLRGCLRLILPHAGPEEEKRFRDWLALADLPALVVVSLPEPSSGAGRPLIAFQVDALKAEDGKAAIPGFARTNAPKNLVLRAAYDKPVRRLFLDRADPAFVTARGGASARIAKRRVVVVGVGSVGSAIAESLAAGGVGTLDLIDADDLSTENVHRHLLGMSDVGGRKVDALSKHLKARFPHLRFVPHEARVEAILEKNRDRLASADLVILATGEETTERRVNRLLRGGPPLLHAWVEPLGIAGHVLYSRNGAIREEKSVGCIECVLVPDETYGLVNGASIVAPGQRIRRSLAGCAGTFSPFSSLDAKRTALEAAQLALSVLGSDARPESCLLSWRGYSLVADAANIRLSGRAAVIQPGQVVRVAEAEFARGSCACCGRAGVRIGPADDVADDAMSDGVRP